MIDRRGLLKAAALSPLATSALATSAFAATPPSAPPSAAPSAAGKADYTIRMVQGLVELSPDQIVSTTVYNGQFPDPLLRFKEGQRVTVDSFNDTDTPELLHWHGQKIPSDVDGAAEEGSPAIAPHNMRRISFVPRPSGFRFYHSHNFAGSDLTRGTYSGQAGPVYIEPANNRGAYDQEIFLVLKEFLPTFSRGGDMASNALAGQMQPNLREIGKQADAQGQIKTKGYEVGYGLFSINGRILGKGETLRVKQGQRVLFHALNASATEIRSLALPGHKFRVIALDGNRVATQAEVPALWLGTGERVSAVVEMNQPGVWVMGDLADDDRSRGMGIVVEYAGATGTPQWSAPPPFRWDYTAFGRKPAHEPKPDETINMLIVKHNGAVNGFNQWTVNGITFSVDNMRPFYTVQQGRRYRLRVRNGSDDIHPMHLHRHSFELVRVAGKPTSGVVKDVVMLGGYQEIEMDFVADNPGRTLFHCHQQLHMDFGLMAMFDYA
ncbi:MAG TPA: multicopper oxidase domain-containing protein [Rhizomicrobium sp.]|nr:multicopper oxidase domain-containing protein [Rhizomicrobium sp.]